MSRLLLTLVFTAFLSVAVLAGPPSLVIVERHSDYIILTRGVGQTEKIKALEFYPPKNHQANAEQLHTVFSKLYAEGYTLQNSSSIGNTNLEQSITTYTFVKP